MIDMHALTYMCEPYIWQPMDILKLQQRKGQSREWDCLPGMSFGFTKMHKGEWRAAERRNLIL
jgi:hypothetical protein